MTKLSNTGILRMANASRPSKDTQAALGVWRLATMANRSSQAHLTQPSNAGICNPAAAPRFSKDTQIASGAWRLAAMANRFFLVQMTSPLSCGISLSGRFIQTLKAHTDLVMSVMISWNGEPDHLYSASLNGVLRIWSIDRMPSPEDLARYTNAKVLFVGDSGVGKTGLYWRLNHMDDEFENTLATDAHSATRANAAWVNQIPLQDPRTGGER